MLLDFVGNSICCILCRGSILYFDETGNEKFGRHMQFEHGAMHDLDFMMAACKMNENEKKALVDVFNNNKKPGDDVNNAAIESTTTTNSSLNQVVEENTKQTIKTQKSETPFDDSTPSVAEMKEKTTPEHKKNVSEVRVDESQHFKDIESSKNSNTKSPITNADSRRSKRDNKLINKVASKEVLDSNDVETNDIPNTSRNYSKGNSPKRAPKKTVAIDDKLKTDVSKDVSESNDVKITDIPNTPKKSKGNVIASPKRTPKKTAATKSEETPYKDLNPVKLKNENNDDIVSPNIQKKNTFKHVIKPISKQIAKYTSRVKNSPQDSIKNLSENRKCKFCEKVYKNDRKLLKHVIKDHPSKRSKSNQDRKSKICLDSPKSRPPLNDREGSPKSRRKSKEEPIKEDAKSSVKETRGVKQKLDNNNEGNSTDLVSDNLRSSKKMKVLSENVSSQVTENLPMVKGTSDQTLTDVVPLPKAECNLCEELSDNKSKLRRHQKYVHGIKVTDVKYVEPTEDDKDIEEEIEDVCKEENKNTVNQVKINSSTSQVDKLTNHDIKELKSCLKKSNSPSRKKLVSFNETIFSQEFDKDASVCDLQADMKISAKDELNSGKPVSVTTENSSKAPNSSIDTSPNTSKVTKAKKRKGEDLHPTSNKKKEIDMYNDQDFQTDTELAMKLSLEIANKDKKKNINPQQDKEVLADKEIANKDEQKNINHQVDKEVLVDGKSDISSETIVLFPCNPCAISFDKMDDLWEHELICPKDVNHDGGAKGVNNMKPKQTNSKFTEESVAKTAGSGRDFSKRRKKSRNTLAVDESSDEELLQETESSKTVVKQEKVQPEPSNIKQENLTEALLNESIDGGMVSLPMDSFLETILTEEPMQGKLPGPIPSEVSNVAKLHDAIDLFTAKLKQRTETQSPNLEEKSSKTELVEKPTDNVSISKVQTESSENSCIRTEPLKDLVKETVQEGAPLVRDVDGLSESLQVKYRRAPKRVDFTQSNFFMKHVELIGKSVNGAGFNETSTLLPEGWKVKTFNEFKKFYLSPDFVVLKSPMAVIEYLRVAINLSHEDLKTLSKSLKIVGKQFDRYLDDLYDDCVVIE